MRPAIVIDRRGNRLVSVQKATGEELATVAAQTPCPLVLVVLVDRMTGRVLFGLNAWRAEYELPGGTVDEGERFDETAHRELEEETGIRVRVLQLLGYARFALVDPLRVELGAVYLAVVRSRHATPSQELLRFVWREPGDETDLPISVLDDAIAAWAVRSVSA